MRNKISFGLYLMTAKGLATLQSFIKDIDSSYVAYVVVAKDLNVTKDYYDEIVELTTRLQIAVYERNQTPPPASHLIAVSWRWLIKPSIEQQLIVFHDSILPRYRGFAPLVGALINGEKYLGVTALLASEEYDRGAIIDQDFFEVEYPLKVAKAIDLLTPCYKNLAIKIADKIIHQRMTSSPQNENEASYSLWRDEDDYYIDWTLDSHYIQRFVDALGFPFKGAATTVEGETLRIRDCIALPDVNIENRNAGKVIFMQGDYPVVVCGKGLIKILSITRDSSLENILPLSKFRTRFI
ncbi:MULTISPECIES: formyltransferase family protein [Pseudomonas]|jgi:methionyl-tRNA formyltransferase|uniref:formyltransferase family protein n=1 Tax=Pseudomonas TaxID=286 RepID=UPI0004BE42F9|nr:MULTISPECIES: formyltransferase family protein [Pseudomonas]